MRNAWALALFQVFDASSHGSLPACLPALRRLVCVCVARRAVQLISMDPNDAWAEWQRLCKLTRAVDDASLDAASERKGMSGALGRWLKGVRAISAANALRGMLDIKLQKANAALMVSGDARAGEGRGGIL